MSSEHDSLDYWRHVQAGRDIVTASDVMAKLLESQRPAWHAKAACRGMGPDLFFDLGRADEAKAVCAGCTVTAECAATADAGREHGVWAGLTITERRRSTSVDRVA
jgi:hypothetical protein